MQPVRRPCCELCRYSPGSLLGKSSRVVDFSVLLHVIHVMSCQQCITQMANEFMLCLPSLSSGMACRAVPFLPSTGLIWRRTKERTKRNEQTHSSTHIIPCSEIPATVRRKKLGTMPFALCYRTVVAVVVVIAAIIVPISFLSIPLCVISHPSEASQTKSS
mmetsp:Transcript_12653/g.26669  ORF Transcript_12653/g.26669 Transcript_12653/m.26669 type:complete len:161 (+) Transcript_12653:72-554(+)